MVGVGAQLSTFMAQLTHGVLHVACCVHAFCWGGSLQDSWTWCFTATGFTAAMTLTVIVFEDLPQLMINIVYINTTTFAHADSIAVFAFVMSLLSVFCNIGLFYYEYRKVR